MAKIGDFFFFRNPWKREVIYVIYYKIEQSSVSTFE